MLCIDLCLSLLIARVIIGLNEFPEFTDEAVNASILSFEGDLKVSLWCFLHEEVDLSIPVVLGLLLAGV